MKYDPNIIREGKIAVTSLTKEERHLQKLTDAVTVDVLASSRPVGVVGMVLHWSVQCCKHTMRIGE